MWTLLMPEIMLRLPQVQQRVPLSRSEIYQRIKDGQFPKQIRLSHKVALWKESDIDAWISEQGKTA